MAEGSVTPVPSQPAVLGFSPRTPPLPVESLGPCLLGRRGSFIRPEGSIHRLCVIIAFQGLAFVFLASIMLNFSNKDDDLVGLWERACRICLESHHPAAEDVDSGQRLTSCSLIPETAASSPCPILPLSEALPWCGAGDRGAGSYSHLQESPRESTHRADLGPCPSCTVSPCPLCRAWRCLFLPRETGWPGWWLSLQTSPAQH